MAHVAPRESLNRTMLSGCTHRDCIICRVRCCRKLRSRRVSGSEGEEEDAQEEEGEDEAEEKEPRRRTRRSNFYNN